MQQHNKSPKRRTVKLVITYIIMTIAVLVISALCILLVLGYRFDLKKGDVEQGALLQFRSFPADAKIELDGQALSFRTPGKKNVSAGGHTVTYTRDGYVPWRKSFSTHASELLWLNYARLVPEKLETTDVRTFPVVTNMLPSPDKKWLLIQQSVDSPEFILADVRNEKEPVFTPLILPAGSYATVAGHPHHFSVMEWDFGARYVIVKHTVADTTEYLRVDRTSVEPSSVINVTAKLGIHITDIHFSGTSGTQFFALEGGNIRKLDAAAGTISQPQVKDVSAFELYKQDVIAYVRQASAEKQEVGVLVGNKPVRVAAYDITTPVYIDISEYFNDYYLAVGRGPVVETYINPENPKQRKKIATTALTSSLQWLRFANSGRFVTAGSGSQFTTYDIETKSAYNVNLPGDAADPAKPLQWLDDYYLVSTANNDIRITEFDGANQHALASSIPNIAASLSDNGKVLFSIAKQQDGSYALQSTKMTLQ